MPTVNQMAALGDLNTGLSILEPASRSMYSTDRVNSLDSVLQAAYNVNNVTAPNGLPTIQSPTWHTLPEVLSGALVAHKA